MILSTVEDKVKNPATFAVRLDISQSPENQISSPMETISRICCITNCTDSPFRIPRLSPIPLRQILLTKRGVSISASRKSSRPEEDEVLQTFLKDRAVNEDIISIKLLIYCGERKF